MWLRGIVGFCGGRGIGEGKGLVGREGLEEVESLGELYYIRLCLFLLEFVY